MEFKSKFMPVVLSGTLAFGTMGMPMSAYAGVVDIYDTQAVDAETVAADLGLRVAAGELTQEDADIFLGEFLAVVEEENAAALAAAEQAEAEAKAKAEAEAKAAEEAAAAEQAAQQGQQEGGEGAGSEGQGSGDEGADDGDGTGEGGEGGEGTGGSGEGDGSGQDGEETGEGDGSGQDGEGTGEGQDGDSDATEDELDRAADEKASQGKHAKTDEEKAAEEQEKYREAAKAYAEQAADAAEQAAADAVAADVYASSFIGVNQGYTRVKYTANLTTEMFIASIGEQARQIGQDKNLYASVMIAQAVIESDSGNSGLAKAPYNNLFGIKGTHEGKSVTMSTQEDNGSGGLYTIDAAFRAYDTQSDSLEDYADLLRGDMGHYYRAWKENADTYKDAAKALQGTYATSTIYADSICAVIEAYDLTRYDQPLDFKIAGKNADGQKLTMEDYAQLQANAVSYLGTPYVWGGTSPDGFDCSGFVQYVYQETLGISLPRTTYTQQYEGEEVAFDDLQMGDLLFFAEGGSTEHVAMYLGDGFYIHAPEPGDSIKITDMESFTPSFAKRVIQTQEA